MNSSVRFGAALAGAFTLALVIAPSARGEFSKSHTLNSESLVVVDLLGEVRVEPAGGTAFEVTVHVQGKDATEELIEVEAREGSEGVVAVRFPVDKHNRYVYPRMEGSSSTRIDFDDDERAGDGWLHTILRGLNGKHITVKSSGRGLEAWADVLVKVPAGKKLRVDLGVGSIAGSNVDGKLFLDVDSGDIDVTALKGKVVLNTGSGEITANGLEGSIVVGTGSGDIQVTACTGDRIEVSTGSGDVQANRLAADALELSTGSGGILARALSADRADFDTGSGDIDAFFDRMGAGPFSASTGSGSIDFDCPTDFSAEFKAETGSGRIRCDVEGAEVLHEDDYEMSFRVGDGDARVKLETGSGSIRVAN